MFARHPRSGTLERAIVLSGHEYTAGKGVALNGADSSPSEKFTSKYSSTSAREKSQLIQFFFHNV
jgi:hypothetical protein